MIFNCEYFLVLFPWLVDFPGLMDQLNSISLQLADCSKPVIITCLDIKPESLVLYGNFAYKTKVPRVGRAP